MNIFTIPIKKFRNLRHLTLEELSEKTEISVSHLSRLEADNIIRSRTTTLLKIQTIAIALEICPRDLVLYNCVDCQLIKKCPKKKVDLDKIIEGNLDYYI